MTQATKTAPRARKAPAAKTIAAEAAPAPRTEAPKAAAPKAAKPAPRFEKAKQAVAGARAFTKGNVEALSGSFGAASKGFSAVRSQSVAFAKARVEANLAAAKSLNSAKSVSDVLDVQHAFAKEAIEAYGQNFARLSEALTASFQGVAKPIGERARAVYASVAPAR
jgi:hypothetical protein